MPAFISSAAMAASPGLMPPTAKLTANNNRVVKLNVDVIEGQNKDQHIVFLHGLFGKGQSFQFLAKAKAIQRNFTCHLVDLRNHGLSERHPQMDYKSIAADVESYLSQAGIDGK